MVAANTPWWTWVWPGLAWLTLLMTSLLGGGIIAAVAGVALLGTVFAAVYHAEVARRRVLPRAAVAGGSRLDPGENHTEATITGSHF